MQEVRVSSNAASPQTPPFLQGPCKTPRKVKPLLLPVNVYCSGDWHINPFSAGWNLQDLTVLNTILQCNIFLLLHPEPGRSPSPPPFLLALKGLHFLPLSLKLHSFFFFLFYSISCIFWLLRKEIIILTRCVCPVVFSASHAFSIFFSLRFLCPRSISFCW